MSDEKIMGHHQMLLIFHRILYSILVVCIFIIYCLNTNQVSVDYWVLLGGTVFISVLEGVISKFAFFNKMFVLRALTYVQYLFYLIMMYRLQENNTSLTIGITGLVLTFMFEFAYYCDITDDLKNVLSFLVMLFPIFAVAIIYFCVKGVSVNAFLMLIAYTMLSGFVVVVVRLFYLNEHRLMDDINSLLRDIDNMEDSNEELMNFKDRVQKVNEELNLQRVQLGQMNQEIQQNNNELEVQADILKFINSSFSMDIATVMNYIIEEITKVRKNEFCGIYIEQDVCYNKKPVSVCKCHSLPNMKTSTDLADIFQRLKESEASYRVFQRFEIEEYPELSKTKSQLLLVIPLVMDGVKYGVLLTGTTKSEAPENSFRFYDVIVPQLDLAIRNIRMYAQMRNMAETDGLTGINNRTHFNKIFAEQMEISVRTKGQLTVVLFDIDKFKRINDTYGHLVGDEVIKSIAKIAYEHIEEKELGFVCRYGGEEFVAAIPNKGIDEVLPIIQKMHEAIASTTVEAYGHIVTMNVSIGISVYPDLCDDVNQLIKRADWSMYYAKEHGRGQIKVDGPDIQES